MQEKKVVTASSFFPTENWEKVIFSTQCASSQQSLYRLWEKIVHDNRCADYERCVVCKFNYKGICHVRNRVYETACQCGDSYVGETESPLNYEFLKYCLVCPGLPSYVDKPFARHRVGKHRNFTSDLRVRSLVVSCNTLEKKIREAMEMRNKRPDINMRREIRATTSLTEANSLWLYTLTKNMPRLHPLLYCLYCANRFQSNNTISKWPSRRYDYRNADSSWKIKCDRILCRGKYSLLINKTWNDEIYKHRMNKFLFLTFTPITQ